MILIHVYSREIITKSRQWIYPLLLKVSWCLSIISFFSPCPRSPALSLQISLYLLEFQIHRFIWYLLFFETSPLKIFEYLGSRDTAKNWT